MSSKPASFAMQMKAFFGMKEGQNTKGFVDELKALDENDKREFTEMLNGAGFPVLSVPQKTD